MTRFVLAVAVALTAVLTFASTASGNHSNGNGPNKDLVAGTGTRLGDPSGDPMIHVNAQNDDPSDPRAVHGHFFIRGPFFGSPISLQGEVICLNVAGPFAVLLGKVTKAENAPTGITVEIEIADLGEPGTTGDVVGWEPFDFVDCEFDFTDTLPVTQGNYIVHDQVSSLFLQGLAPQLAEFEEAAGRH